MFKLKKMIEKRFVEHDTSVEDYVGKSRKQEHERENDTKCEIAGNVFGKRKARRGRIAKHRARWIKKHLADFIRAVSSKDERIMSLQV